MSKLIAILKNRYQSWLHAGRAGRYYRRREFAEAVDEYEKALEWCPGRAIIHFNLGLALYKLGKKSLAREQWKTVMELVGDGESYLAEQTEILLRQFG